MNAREIRDGLRSGRLSVRRSVNEIVLAAAEGSMTVATATRLVRWMLRNSFLRPLAAARVLGRMNQAVDDRTRRLRVLTWNVFLMPIQGARDAVRARHIARLLNARNDDIVVLQKVWVNRAQRILIDGLKQTFGTIIEPANHRRLSLSLDSGLLIAARRPLRFVDHLVYAEQAVSAGERMAQKGATMIEFEFGAKKVQLVNTHMHGHAKSARKQNEVKRRRLAQAEQLRTELLEPHRRRGCPQFVAGDLSFPRTPGRGDDDDAVHYREMLRALDAVRGDGAVGGLGHTALVDGALARSFQNEPEVKDYVLGCGPSAIRGRGVRRAARRLQASWRAHSSRSHDLSYRAALAASIDCSGLWTN